MKNFCFFIAILFMIFINTNSFGKNITFDGKIELRSEAKMLFYYLVNKNKDIDAFLGSVNDIETENTVASNCLKNANENNLNVQISANLIEDELNEHLDIKSINCTIQSDTDTQRNLINNKSTEPYGPKIFGFQLDMPYMEAQNIAKKLSKENNFTLSIVDVENQIKNIKNIIEQKKQEENKILSVKMKTCNPDVGFPEICRKIDDDYRKAGMAVINLEEQIKQLFSECSDATLNVKIPTSYIIRLKESNIKYINIYISKNTNSISGIVFSAGIFNVVNSMNTKFINQFIKNYSVTGNAGNSLTGDSIMIKNDTEGYILKFYPVKISLSKIDKYQPVFK